MPINEDFLDRVHLFTGLTPAERRRLGTGAIEQTWAAGEAIFREGEPGESMFLVAEGAVELSTEVGEDVQRPLITIRPGRAFGLVEAIDAQSRGVTATAIEPTTTLELTRATIADYVDADPASGVTLVSALSAGLAHQSRIAMDLLRQNLAWTLEVSGATQLNLNRLMSDRVRICVDLANGNQVSGTLLKLEASPAGHELLVKAEGDRIRMIPYHAIISLWFGVDDVPPEEEAVPEL